MAYYFVAIAGLTVLTGQNGQISLGHGALMAVGAYATVKIQDGRLVALAAVLLAAAIVTAVVRRLAGAAAARLRGPYLAGATLALAVGLPALATKFSGFLGGSNGLTVAPPIPPASLGATFPLERWQAWIACLAALVALRAAGQPRAQRLRARVPRRPRRRDRRAAGGLSRRAHAGHGLRRQRRLRRAGRRAARRRHLAGGARSVPAQPVGRAAHRRHPRRARAAWSARSGARRRSCSSPPGPTTPARRCRCRPTSRPTSRWPSTASCSSA